MPDTVLFPDVEAVLVSALSGRVGVPVSTGVPNPRPDSFVLVRRVGGTCPNVITDRAAVAVECWSTSGVDACDLSRWTRAYIHTLAPRHRAARGRAFGPVVGSRPCERVAEVHVRSADRRPRRRGDLTPRG